MSFVTRCTSCGTLFRVVADQLKVSDGWVRCGQCGAVFDAQSQLVDEPTAPAPAQSSFAPLPATLSAPPTTTHPKSNDSGSSSLAVGESASRPQPAQLASLKADQASGADSRLESRLDSRSFRPGVLRDSGEVDSEAGPSTSTWASSEYPQRSAEPPSISISAEPTTIHSPSSVDASLAPPLDASGPSTTPQPTPGFVKQAQRARRWRSPWVRLALCLFALSLLAVLALQIALHDKNRIAAQWPQTKPWLDELCQKAGCQVQAMKRIEVITIDASSFNRINKNNPQLEAMTQSYRLGVTLKNTGQLPVALPHLELSLQDPQDQTILRRVLSPADLGSSLPALAPSQDLAASATLQIDTAKLAGSRISGYRVLAFYP